MQGISHPLYAGIVQQAYEERYRQGVLLFQQKKFNESLSIANEILGLCPNEPSAMYLAGKNLLSLNNLGLAIQMLSGCLKKAPDFYEAWLDLGACLRQENHFEEALFAASKSIELKPTPEAYVNLSALGADSGDPERALSWIDKVLELNPDFTDGLWNKALAHLSKRDWPTGWKLYQNRRNLGKNKHGAQIQFWYPRDKINAPDILDIEQLRAFKPNSRILIHGEQGVGDEIMFMSVFEDFWHDVDCKFIVDVECERRLQSLFKRSFGWVNQVVTGQDEVSDVKYDAKVSMGELCGFYRQKDDDFHGRPYLKADQKRIEEYRHKLPKGSIGLAWQGGTKATRGYSRSIPLELLTPIIAGRSVVSVQYGEGGKSGAKAAMLHHFDGASDGQDIDSQAALMCTLDCVVTVSQTAFHLAGALGVPCYVMTPAYPDWRIGVPFIEERAEPLLWYDSVRLVRQRKEESWQPVIDCVAELLG